MTWALHIASFGSKTASSFALRKASQVEDGERAVLSRLEKPRVVGQLSNGRVLSLRIKIKSY